MFVASVQCVLGHNNHDNDWVWRYFSVHLAGTRNGLHCHDDGVLLLCLEHGEMVCACGVGTCVQCVSACTHVRKICTLSRQTHIHARTNTYDYMQGLITSLLTDTPYSVARFNETMDELLEFMGARGLNADLIGKVKSFYMLKFPAMRIYDEGSVLDGLPRGLSRAVKTELFADVLTNCPLFYGMDVSLDIADSGNQSNSSVAGDICTRIGAEYKLLGLELTCAGDFPDALYIVRHGSVAVFADGKVFSHICTSVFACPHVYACAHTLPTHAHSCSYACNIRHERMRIHMPHMRRLGRRYRQMNMHVHIRTFTYASRLTGIRMQIRLHPKNRSFTRQLPGTC